MTKRTFLIKELIEKLSQYDGELKVFLDVDNNTSKEILTVNDGYINPKSDELFNMYYEDYIQCREMSEAECEMGILERCVVIKGIKYIKG